MVRVGVADEDRVTMSIPHWVEHHPLALVLDDDAALLPDP
jgi:hypothetical protein